MKTTAIKPTHKGENMETIINENKAKEIIVGTGGSIFSVQFIKKDGSIRDMTCRLHVKKYLKTGKPSTTAHIPKYITVFEMKGEAAPVYRNINVETLLTLKANNVQYCVAHQATGC
jgi:hypothetical protein